MQSDTFDRSIHHRSLTVADTVALNLAERTRLINLQSLVATDKEVKKPDTVNGLVATFGAGDLEFSFFAIGSDGNTFDATLVGVPAILDRLVAGTPKVAPALIRLAKLNVTLGTNGETNINPVNGETVTGNWLAADTLVVAVEGTGIKLWDAAGLNGVARALIDPLQCPHVFMYIDNIVGATRVEVMVRRLGRYTC